MNLTLRVYVRLMRLFWRAERSKESVRAVRGDGRAKLISVCVYAKKACLVISTGLSLVLKIGGSRNITQIEKGIVGSIAIDVVSVINWPRASDIKPRQAVFSKQSAVDRYLTVALRIDASRPVANSYSGAGSNQSRKDAGLWIVVQQFAQTLNRQLFHPFILSFPRRFS